MLSWNRIMQTLSFVLFLLSLDTKSANSEAPPQSTYITYGWERRADPPFLTTWS